MLAALIPLLAVIVYRVAMAAPGSTEAGWLQNFSPLAAVALCGAIYLPRRIAVALPLAALFISDLLLNARYGVALLNPAMLPQYGALGLIAALGWMMRGRASVAQVLGASLISSVIFYAVTNTGAWLMEPRYARSLAGWWQALTLGLPGYSPTWVFFRNTVLSDLAFTGLFLACLRFRAPQLEPVRVTA